MLNTFQQTCLISKMISEDNDTKLYLSSGLFQVLQQGSQQEAPDETGRTTLKRLQNNMLNLTKAIGGKGSRIGPFIRTTSSKIRCTENKEVRKTTHKKRTDETGRKS